jgi:hypothetical protein
MPSAIPAASGLAAFEAWAKRIAAETGFVLGQKIYHGIYYSQDHVRNAIYEGMWQDKAAVLKMYDDPRLSDEPQALEEFNRSVQTGELRALRIYASHMESPKRGWLIIEHLPEGGSFFRSPLSIQEKETFTELYMQYRRQFPCLPTRPLMLGERLPANEYHRQRIARWFQLANDREEMRRMDSEVPLLSPDVFLPKYLKALKAIGQEFTDRKMVWCHGHFKPHEIYRLAEGGYILTDFAHSKMYPEGYELAFIIWSDCLMMTDWRMGYEKWKKGIDEWLNAFRARIDGLALTRFEELMRTSLLERCLGTILADLTASDRPRDELEGRLDLLLRLTDELLI